MSGNLSSLALGGGAIKSIQRGLSAPGAVTITSVNTAKTELRFLGATNDAASTVRLTNSTTVTVGGGGTAVSWELTEYY